jgi:glyoxylase-like metal-dependent hydrolase (beta-lactamase superfamily II)
LPYLAGEPSPQPERRVHDGELIEFGQAALKVIHCPGHTPGDIALHTQGAVITGDVLFVDAVGRTDLPGSSLQTLEHSLRYKLATLPDDTIVYPGHDYGHAVTSTIGAEKQHNPFMRAALKD